MAREWQIRSVYIQGAALVAARSSPEGFTGSAWHEGVDSESEYRYLGTQGFRNLSQRDISCVRSSYSLENKRMNMWLKSQPRVMCPVRQTVCRGPRADMPVSRAPQCDEHSQSVIISIASGQRATTFSKSESGELALLPSRRSVCT